MTKPGRQRGSARFATYYKVQVFNDRNACWDDNPARLRDRGGGARRLPAGPALPGDGSDAARAAADRVIRLIWRPLACALELL
jgi:hypothetical protein